MKLLTLGIDASNIRAGGGLTHLSQLLNAANPPQYGIQKVVIWGGLTTLRKLPQHDWIIKKHVCMLDWPLPFRMVWQQLILPFVARKSGCNALFAPGGTLPLSISVPTFVMSQNLLPFEEKESARFGALSFMRRKMKLLKKVQSRSISSADGVIFLTDYARHIISSVISHNLPSTTICPHGIEDRFFFQPRPALPLSTYSDSNPFRLLYVSIVDVYKHQWEVAKAVSSLKLKGFPIEIKFIGPAYPPALRKLTKVLQDNDAEGTFLHYCGPVPFEELHTAYQQADAFVFASSCENMPNILLEAMAAGLPIACSNKGPMPEVLGNAGLYFDPENPLEIEDALRMVIEHPEQRSNMANEAYKKARAYSWKRCAQETCLFISEVLSESINK